MINRSEVSTAGQADRGTSRNRFWPEPLAEASRYSNLIFEDTCSDLPRPAGAFLAANPLARAAAGGVLHCQANDVAS